MVYPVLPTRNIVALGHALAKKKPDRIEAVDIVRTNRIRRVYRYTIVSKVNTFDK